MAPRGKKTQTETETVKAAPDPAETSTEAANLSTDAAETGAAQDLGQPDPVAMVPVVADAMTGSDGASGPDSVPARDPETAPAEVGAVDATAEASSAAASQVLDAILAQAEATPAPAPKPATGNPDLRWFQVTDPVSLDGKDYAIGDDVALTRAAHADLLKARVVSQPWIAGTEVF